MEDVEATLLVFIVMVVQTAVQQAPEEMFGGKCTAVRACLYLVGDLRLPVYPTVRSKSHSSST